MKKHLLTTLAVIVAATLFAFTPKQKSVTKLNDQESYWFFEDTHAEEATYTNYTNVPLSVCEDDGNLRCEILAFPNPSDNTKPDLTRPITIVSMKP